MLDLQNPYAYQDLKGSSS